jgi:hypothetical protein
MVFVLRKASELNLTARIVLNHNQQCREHTGHGVLHLYLFRDELPFANTTVNLVEV